MLIGHFSAQKVNFAFINLNVLSVIQILILLTLIQGHSGDAKLQLSKILTQNPMRILIFYIGIKFRII